MDLSIIIPSFNGGTLLNDLVWRINVTLSGKFTYEIIFIFDHGKKKTWQIIKELKHELPGLINIYHLAKNYGQHKAIQFGFSKANGDFLVTIDEDLQHDPADIPKLIEKQLEGNYDVIYGKFTNLNHKEIRYRLSQILRKVLKHFIPHLYKNYSPYRLIKREIARKTITKIEQYTFIDDLLSRITQNIEFVDILQYPRLKGKSSYTLFRLIKHGTLIILTYSRINYLLMINGGILMLFGFIIILLKVIASIRIFLNPFHYEILPGAGLILLITGALGIIIKYMNKKRNTRPVQILV